MPSVKQGGGYTLTFAKKNQDVKEHLDTLKENKVVITDYLCEAVRFYEKNKNSELQSSLDNMDIDKIIEEKIKALMGNNIRNNNEESSIEKEINIENINNLEDGLDDIPDEDIEED
ncbi:MAG: hypothetical protein ACRDDM_04125 [Paraclostridium sp.]